MFVTYEPDAIGICHPDRKHHPHHRHHIGRVGLMSSAANRNQFPGEKNSMQIVLLLLWFSAPGPFKIREKNLNLKHGDRLNMNEGKRSVDRKNITFGMLRSLGSIGEGLLTVNSWDMSDQADTLAVSLQLLSYFILLFATTNKQTNKQTNN